MNNMKSDSKNRCRNIVISFRVSPKEQENINMRVKLSGLTKQEYISRRCMEQDIIVNGNPHVYKALKDQFAAVLTELQRIECGASTDEALLQTIQMINATMQGMQSNPKNQIPASTAAGRSKTKYTQHRAE